MTITPVYSSSTSMTTSSIGSRISLGHVVLCIDHARARNAQLEAFAAHRLDEHAQLQFAAAGDLEASLSALAVTRMATLPSASFSRRSRITRLVTLSPSRAGQRRVVDREGHGERRRIDRLGLDRLGHHGSADGVGHGRLGQARDRNDVARLALVDRHALQAAEGQHLGDAAGAR
jgi:hypothetical protein